ncbi:hypothetical protein [Cypionkella sp.]|uniref:hypothetical protein n=1 Tax=Cypionkella sp. TaxID=2811411 RepID=UPI0026324BBF|nr:hypothetical protein [Cypionkella sp.]MDB5666439.1 hypothetical protein [Cypionkella sp.]
MRHSNSTRINAVPRIVAAVGGFMALLGCNLAPAQLPPFLSDVEDTTAFIAVPTGQAWINAPAAIVVTERGLTNSREQRIGLVNQTAVRGDNMMTLRARVVDGQMQGRFRYEEFLRRIGGLPAPFTAMKSGDLLTGEDALGMYLWAENRIGSNTICVLGLRRLDTGMRQMPGDTNVLDVMMRNCVNGDVDAALEPMMASSIGNAAGAAAASAEGSIQMLSPLAGPTP